jgi:hypothetical protein
LQQTGLRNFWPKQGRRFGLHTTCLGHTLPMAQSCLSYTVLTGTMSPLGTSVFYCSGSLGGSVWGKAKRHYGHLYLCFPCLCSSHAILWALFLSFKTMLNPGFLCTWTWALIPMLQFFSTYGTHW